MVFEEGVGGGLAEARVSDEDGNDVALGGERGDAGALELGLEAACALLVLLAKLVVLGEVSDGGVGARGDGRGGGRW